MKKQKKIENIKKISALCVSLAHRASHSDTVQSPQHHILLLQSSPALHTICLPPVMNRTGNRLWCHCAFAHGLPQPIISFLHSTLKLSIPHWSRPTTMATFSENSLLILADSRPPWPLDDTCVDELQDFISLHVCCLPELWVRRLILS